MHLGIGKTEARENVVWQGGGRRRADARQGRQRSPRPILAAELYRFSSVSAMVVNAGDGPGVDFFFAGPYTVAIPAGGGVPW